MSSTVGKKEGAQVAAPVTVAAPVAGTNVPATAATPKGTGKAKTGQLGKDRDVSAAGAGNATTFELPPVKGAAGATTTAAVTPAGAPAADGAPPVAGTPAVAPTTYDASFGSQSYVKNGGDPKLLELAKQAAAADPALAGGAFGEAVKKGTLAPEDIKTLQTSLQAKGYSVGHAGVDGKFGPDTHKALQSLLAGAPPDAPPDAAATPGDPAATPGTPGTQPQSATDAAAIERLKKMSPKELAQLGKTDKKAFFEALRPAAEEAERKYGVPASVTLAQAGLESGYGQHTPGGDSFNFFGIKKSGPAGRSGQYAKYHNAHEAIMEHGKLFHNGYYKKAMDVAKAGGGPEPFLKSIEGIYHESGSKYTRDSMAIIRKYNL